MHETITPLAKYADSTFSLPLWVTPIPLIISRVKLQKAKRKCLLPASLRTAVYCCRCRKINNVWIIQMHVFRYISFFLRWINNIDALFTNSSLSQTNTSSLFIVKHIFSSFIPMFIDSASYVQILFCFFGTVQSEKLVSVRCLRLSVTKTWRMKNDEGLGEELVLWRNMAQNLFTMQNAIVS